MMPVVAVKKKICAPHLLLSLSLGFSASVLSLPSSANVDKPNNAGSVSLRRLTEPQYRQSIADIFGADIKVIGTFEPDIRVHGLLAEGTTRVAVTPGGLEQYENIARGIANQVIDEQHWPKLVGCAPQKND